MIWWNPRNEQVSRCSYEIERRAHSCLQGIPGFVSNLTNVFLPFSHHPFSAHKVPRASEKDRHLPQPASHPAPREDSDLRAEFRGLVWHALPRQREDLPALWVQPARRLLAAHHTLSGIKNSRKIVVEWKLYDMCTWKFLETISANNEQQMNMPCLDIYDIIYNIKCYSSTWEKLYAYPQTNRL